MSNNNKSYDMSCSTCAHFRQGDTDGGECRRYPPSAIEDEGESITYAFVSTRSDWLCGEFKRKVN